MSEPTAQRTLVKSPPELWAEVSDAESLAKHLGEFGEIKITRLEPETTVAWEGEVASGAVQIEPSGWGTKVTLTAVVPEPPEPEPEPVAVEPVAVEPEPEPVVEPPAPPTASELLERSGFFARMFGRNRLRGEIPEPPPSPEPELPEPDTAPDPEPEEDPLPEPTPFPEREPDPMPPAAETQSEHEPDALQPERVEELLCGVLDSLGSAHHRPFSRQ